MIWMGYDIDLVMEVVARTDSEQSTRSTQNNTTPREFFFIVLHNNNGYYYCLFDRYIFFSWLHNKRQEWERVCCVFFLFKIGKEKRHLNYNCKVVMIDFGWFCVKAIFIYIDDDHWLIPLHMVCHINLNSNCWLNVFLLIKVLIVCECGELVLMCHMILDVVSRVIVCVTSCVMQKKIVVFWKISWYFFCFFLLERCVCMF